MVKFLDSEEEFKLRKFVQYDLTKKYDMSIQINDGMVVSGVMGNDFIEEALKISFNPADANVMWIEDKIATDIHRFCYENKINMNRQPIQRDAWMMNIRYTLIYTDGGV